MAFLSSKNFRLPVGVMRVLMRFTDKLRCYPEAKPDYEDIYMNAESIHYIHEKAFTSHVNTFSCTGQLTFIL